MLMIMLLPASCSLAPYPAAKMKVVLQNIQDAEAYMAEGR